MKILSLDTSTKHFSLAVSDKDKVICTKTMQSGKILSSAIIPAIEKVLKKANVRLNKIDGFAIGVGPGSFTSLRVGTATIKGLAYALNKPIVGVASLDLIAFNVKKKTGQVCVLGDARRNMVFGCVYERGMPISDYHLTGLEEMLALVSEDVVFVGDGLKNYKHDVKQIMKKVNPGLKVDFEEKESMWLPKARQLAKIAYVQFQNKMAVKAEELLPLYLYPDDCQVRR